MSFFEELRQRKVVRVATGYLVAAWIGIQAASIALPAFDAPPWVLRVFILMFVLGFPLALVLSWALDITSEGIKPSPRSKSDKAMAVLALLLIAGAVGWYYWKSPQVISMMASKPAAPVASPAPAITTQATPTTSAAAAPPAPPAVPATAATSMPTTKPLPATQTQAPRPVATERSGMEARPRHEAPHMLPPRGTENAESARTELSPRCREIIQQARAERESGELTRGELRRERYSAQAQLRDAGCLEGLRQGEPGARFGRH